MYFRCDECLSLQTEEPYWLDEAYADEARPLDIGRAQRNVLNAMLCAHILGQLGIQHFEPCLDWGAGEGLFVRFLRDRGFNFFGYDKYRQPVYDREFRTDAPARVDPAVVTAFEIFEHLPHPSQDLARIFASRPRLLLATTEPYEDQKEDWWYLSPFSGQHVFFYSPSGLGWIADRFGYRYVALPQFHAFVRTDDGKDAKSISPERLENLVASKDGLYAEAVQSLAGHFLVDPWKDVNSDYLMLRKTMYGY